VLVNFSTFANGTYTLTVKSCTVTLSACTGPSVSRSIAVKSLHPVLATSPSAFSPNGDKRADVVTATLSLPDAERVTWAVRNSAGTVVRGNVFLGYLASGKHTFTWNGLNNSGRRVPDGVYTLSVSTSNATPTRAATLFGLATRAVRVDVTAPAITAVAAVTGTFYPYPDSFKDSITPKVTVNEPGTLSMIVKNSAGTVVRTLVLKHSAAGTLPVTWNGIVNGGARAPAGTYSYRFLAEDPALNRRLSGSYSVAVSAAKLVGTTVTKVVTPAATKTGVVAGSCSVLLADSAWAGGYDYVSGYYYYTQGYCPDPNDPYLDIVATDHQLTLPAAVKYAGISVVATGEELDPGYGDQAYGWYRDTSGALVGNGATLGASYSSYSFGAASPSLLYGGRTLRWTVATDSGQWYAVQSFTVRYTYYVLK
jgi:flagellar hook assembly protein FlgD